MIKVVGESAGQIGRDVDGRRIERSDKVLTELQHWYISTPSEGMFTRLSMLLRRFNSRMHTPTLHSLVGC
jgi:hypothetical protein